LVELSHLTLIIIFQVMFVLFVFVIFLVFLLRSKNTNIEKLIIKAGKHEEESPIASVKFYLTAEAKITELRFNQLYSKEDLEEQDFTEPDWLILRKHFLEIEKEFLLNEERVDSFWVDVGDRFKALLKRHHLVKRIKSVNINPNDSEDQVSLKNLLNLQFDALENISTDLANAKTEEEIDELKNKLSTAIRTHTELSHCVNMIGDENEFLRRQINELVKRPV